MVRIIAQGNESYEVRVAAPDYFSECAIITGLLAAFGLDIQDGALATANPTGGPRILNVFHVRARPAHRWTPHRQRQFRAELELLIGLLAQDQYQEARARVNRKLTERLAAASASPARLQTITVSFDNQSSPAWTVMDVEAPDQPGFLYAWTNALAMRGMTIHAAQIRTRGRTVRDRFSITDRRGRKIIGARAQTGLRITAVLIKQFTHCLAAAPDPAKALAHFDRLLDSLLDQTTGAHLPAFLHEQATLDLLARLFGSSDFLWEDFLRLHLDSLLPVLRNFTRQSSPVVPPLDKASLGRRLRRASAGAGTHDARKQIINRLKDQELFRIDMRHLMDPQARLEPFSRALTDLADIVLAEALRACQTHLSARFGRPRLAGGALCTFAIFGLGKFGGREMGYASDIEVLFAYDGEGNTDGPESLSNGEYFEHLCQALLQFITAKDEGIFHLDVRLRPHGRTGFLAGSLDDLRRYYSPAGLAAPFERQALIKLRWVAGSRALGRRMEQARDRFVYSGAPWDIRAAVDLRRRQIRELVTPGTINVKHSPGGLIDIEYATQYLQIMHGAARPALRTPSTLDALAALRRRRRLSPSETIALRQAYRFLRRVIDALRIVRGNARDLVLPALASEEFTFLARRLGYHAPHWKTAAARLHRDIVRHMTRTHRLFAKRFQVKSRSLNSDMKP